MSADLVISDTPNNLNVYGLRQDILERLQNFDLSTRLSEFRPIRGNGAFSDITRGLLAPLSEDEAPQEVSVKRMRFYLSDSIKQLFEKEVYIWSKLRHDNIARFLGYAFDDRNYPILISVWMKRGSAWKFVRDNKDFDVFPLVVGLAKGLNYLHGDMNAIHSDIKGENVLISDTNPPDAILCDFGTSRINDASLSIGQPSSTRKGTLRWLAYEIMTATELGYTKKTDVWAFGMTVYELLTRKRPYHRYSQDSNISDAIKRGDLPDVVHDSDGQRNEILEGLCTACWKLDPEERVTIACALDSLCPEAQAANAAM